MPTFFYPLILFYPLDKWLKAKKKFDSPLLNKMELGIKQMMEIVD